MLVGGQTNGDVGDSNTIFRDHNPPMWDSHLDLNDSLFPAHTAA